MTTFCIGHTDTVKSIWYVVDAVNKHPDFQIWYPSSHEEQRAIAEGFLENTEWAFLLYNPTKEADSVTGFSWDGGYNSKTISHMIVRCTIAYPILNCSFTIFF
jgi:hypothetical protein